MLVNSNVFLQYELKNYFHTVVKNGALFGR